MKLLEMPTTGSPRGSATLMARALRVEEAQVVLSLDACKIDARATETQRLDLSRRHDRLQSQINSLVQTVATFLGLDWDSRLDGIRVG